MEKAYDAYMDLEGRGVKVGVGPLRKEYIAEQRKLAYEEVISLAIYGVKIHTEEMVSDGWGDGMKVLQVIAEEPDGTLVKLKWHDGNKEFFKACRSAGSAPYNYKKRLGK